MVLTQFNLHYRNKFVSDPNAIVHLHQRVRVKVKQVDFKRNRIGLSMKNVEQ